MWCFAGFLNTTDFTGVVMRNYIVVHGIHIAKDFVPETFGRLTTIGPWFALAVNRKGHRKWFQVCQCSCGNIKVVLAASLRNGNTKSCGCLQKEVLARINTIHGKYRTPEYGIRISMLQRCYNTLDKRYYDYGGRGIQVCDRWLDPENGFLNFLDDMGPRPSPKHSLDRIDNDKNYCPENCRWSTMKEQSRNRRNNAMITHEGKTQCIADWTEEAGLPKGVLGGRLKKGWSVEKAITTPVNRKKLST